VLSQSIIHEPLGSGWGISEPKGYDKEFKELISGSKGAFPFVAFLDTDLVETSSKVKACEIFTTPNLVESFFNSR